MTDDAGRPLGHQPGDETDPGPEPRRLFLFEPGWRITLKVGSEREFCYMMAPGQDYYHRLYDGEVYLVRGDEKLCMACAGRRGLIDFRPKGLRETIASFEFDAPVDLQGFEIRNPE